MTTRPQDYKTNQIVCLGLSHHTAPVAVRERLSCSLTDLNGLLKAQRADIASPLEELVILSTCNRMELYAAVPTNMADPRGYLTRYLAKVRGVDMVEFADYLFYFEGEKMAAHLANAAAGLDSRILGEPQILGQVTDAYMTAVKNHTAGPILRRVFETAIRAGKRARTETAISANPASISSIAIAQARKITGDLSRKSAIIIGAGEMAELALKALQARKIGEVTVVNRSCPRARDLTAQWGGSAYGLDRLDDLLLAADIVISATGAPHYILDAVTVEETMKQRNGRTLVLIDIAVPRDIEPKTGLISGIHLFDVDGLQDNLDKALAARRQEAPQVETIIAEEIANLNAQLCELTAKPFITDLRQKAEIIRQRELERTLRHLGNVDPQVLEHFQYLSRSLVNKLLHEPTIRVKQEASNGRAAAYVATARHLFGLEDRVQR
ncbi:MAG: glutamyl-tRNA reductase [Chloroflexi bacterium]|nr:glutamyl-tRNA reductase [Chloroflexota bacterium]